MLKNTSWLNSLVLAAFWVLLASTAASGSSLESPSLATGRIERLSSSEGLSSNFVTCIHQDLDGMLWFGTQAGLNRFDGHRFVVYRAQPDALTGLSDDWISVIEQDPSGDLWIGTEGGGLSRWLRERDEFQTFRHDPDQPTSLSGDRVLTIAFDKEGFLWVGTLDSGLNRFDPSTGTSQRFRHDPADPMSLSDDGVREVLADRHGNIWVGTLSGLDQYIPSEGKFVRRSFKQDPEALEGEDRTLALAEDDSGLLWIGTEHGLNQLDPETGKITRFFHDPDDSSSLNHDWVRTVYPAADGKLWVGTDGGLNLWLGGKQFESFKNQVADDNRLSNALVIAIFEDRGGLLWISTLGEGINKWNPQGFSRLRSRVATRGGPNNKVFAISEDQDQVLWVGTFGGGILKVDRGTGHQEVLLPVEGDPNSLSGDRVVALLSDRDGYMWAGTVAAGLNRFDPARQMFTRYVQDPEDPESIGANAITSLFQDAKGAVWVGTYGAGLDLFDGVNGFVHHLPDPSDPTSLSHDRVFSIAEDSGGALWLATGGGGLNRLAPDRQSFSSFRFSEDAVDGPTSDELVVVHINEAQVLWIGTKNRGLDQLVSYDEETGRAVFRNFSSADGLIDNNVFGIESDAKGYIWLSTNGGLSRFDPAREQFKNFDISHGLQSTEFNQGAHFKSPRGELFFGGVDGLNAFFPELMDGKRAPPPVVLTDFSLLNQHVEFDGPTFGLNDLQLNHDDRFLSFEFAALDYAAPERNQYRYKVEGIDDTWIDLGTERKVTFPSMVPGNYVLRVQGANNDGIWNEEGLALAISVKPPFWRSWWFKGALLLTAISLVLLAHQVGMQRIERNNERLQMLVRERTQELEETQEQLVRKEKLAVLGELAGSVAHEIRNPLGAIKNSVYFLRLTQKFADDKANEHLSLIDRQIERSDRIISELLDYAREPTAHVGLEALQLIVRRALEELEVPGSIRLIRRLDKEPALVLVDPGQIERILSNFLNNAIQAMPDGGDLTIECGQQGEEAVARVIDTGVGISKEDQARIFEPLYTRKVVGIGLGLTLSQRYAKRNGGRIDCQSELGVGTAFSLCLPLRQASELEG